jgi:DNA repair exonuclease SbcCD nuclease subunit
VKILVISDTQLGAGKNLAANRLADQEAVLDQIVFLANEEEVALVVHCGDVFDSRTPSDEARLVFRRFAKRIANGLRDFIVVAGNHDLKNAALPSPVDLTDDYYDFVRDPRVIQTRAGAIACLPWAPPGHYIASRNGSTREQLNAEIAALVIKTADWLRSEHPGPMILAGHWMVSGGSLPNGLPVDQFGGPVLPLADLEELGFDLCLFGDVHVPEPLGSGRVISVGSPALNDWGEEETGHGVWVIDTENLSEPDWSPLKDRRFQTVDVDLTNCFELATLDGVSHAPPFDPRVDEDETDVIAALLAEEFPLTDAVVRLLVKATAEQIRRVDFAAIRKLAEDAGVHKLVIAPPDIERVERARVEGVTEALSVPEALDLWIDHNGESVHRPESLRTLTGELLEEVEV